MQIYLETLMGGDPLLLSSESDSLTQKGLILVVHIVNQIGNAECY